MHFIGATLVVSWALVSIMLSCMACMQQQQLLPPAADALTGRNTSYVLMCNLDFNLDDNRRLGACELFLVLYRCAPQAMIEGAISKLTDLCSAVTT